jgi:hypothetical protein
MVHPDRGQVDDLVNPGVSSGLQEIAVSLLFNGFGAI